MKVNLVWQKPIDHRAFLFILNAEAAAAFGELTRSGKDDLIRAIGKLEEATW